MTQPAQPAPPIPPPQPQPESDFYWEKCKAHELWLRHCKSCDRTYFYPRDICPLCFSRDTDWVQTNGKGTLYAFSIVHRGPQPCFPRQGALRYRRRGARGRRADAHQPGGGGSRSSGREDWNVGGSGIRRPDRYDQPAKVQAGGLNIYPSTFGCYRLASHLDRTLKADR